MSNEQHYPLLLATPDQLYELVPKHGSSFFDHPVVPASKNELIASVIWGNQETDNTFPGLKEHNYYMWSKYSSSKLSKLCWPPAFVRFNDGKWLRYSNNDGPLENYLSNFIGSLAPYGLPDTMNSTLQASLNYIIHLGFDHIPPKERLEINFDLQSANYVVMQENNNFVFYILFYEFSGKPDEKPNTSIIMYRGYFAKLNFDYDAFVKNKDRINSIIDNIKNYIKKLPIE